MDLVCVRGNGNGTSEQCVNTTIHAQSRLFSLNLQKPIRQHKSIKAEGEKSVTNLPFKLKMSQISSQA